MKTCSPEFSALVAQYQDTAAGLGNDHPFARRLWMLVLATAPAWFLEQIAVKAKELGLMPEAWGCDDNGRKFYAFEDIATKLGMDADEVKQQIAHWHSDAVAVGLPSDMLTNDTCNLHRMQ